MLHDITLLLPDCVESLAKNAPSIDMGEWLAADRLKPMGWSSSWEKLQAMKLDSDHRPNSVQVLAIANTLGQMSEEVLLVPLPVLPS